MFQYHRDLQHRIGYDFYADTAERIVKEREKNGLTQEQLAKKAGIPLSRLGGYERVQVRIRLNDLESIAAVLGVSVDYLIGASYDDPDCGECLYTVYREGCEEGERFALYFKASSPEMAFLKAYQFSIDNKFIWFEPRDRAIVTLKGVPVRKTDYSKFRQRNSEDDDQIS